MFVPCTTFVWFSHLRAEWACIPLQFRIHHLYKRHNQVQLSTTTDNTKRFASPLQCSSGGRLAQTFQVGVRRHLTEKKHALMMIDAVQQLVFILKTTT